MESFIFDIYKNAFIIEGYKEFISLIDAGKISFAREIYNKTASDLESLLSEISATDPVWATQIQKTALEIKDNYDDPCLAKGLINKHLLPELYSYISYCTNISVTDSKYTIKSSATGFLTIMDNNLNIHLHDTYDPMYEAAHIIRSQYKPEMDGFLIFGCGLGYIAYQVYKQSFGSSKIYIYEYDENILEYAIHYGVLSLIPDSIIEILHDTDANAVTELFLTKLQEPHNYGFVISPWVHISYNGIWCDEIKRLNANHSLSIETAELATINLRINSKLDHIDFRQIIPMYNYNEWVIISAGPSLDDCIPFLKGSKHQRGLIAVNTVLRRLLNEGIIPDIIAAADASNSLFEHIRGIEYATKDILLIADWLLNWKYTSSFLGQICFVRTNAGSDLASNNIPNEPIWDISGTVACLGIEAAARLGAKKIYLAGQDLAYPGGRKYAKNMPHEEAPNAKWEMQVSSVDGGMVGTCEAFDWFRKAIEHQVAKYDHIKFINLSKHGAMIKGTFKNS